MDELEAELTDAQIAEKLKLLANELVTELSKCKDFPLFSQLEERTENNSSSSSCETYLTEPGNRADAIPPTFGEAVDDSEGNADALDQDIEIKGGITQDEIPCDADNSSPGGSMREITSNSLHLVDSDIASLIVAAEKIQEERNDSYQCNERHDSSRLPNEEATSSHRKKVLCVCGKFICKGAMKHHIKRSCRGKNAEDSYLGKRVACPNCGKVVSASNLAKHMKRYCKQMCLSKISSKHPNEKATSSHSKKGLCICGKFICKGAMKHHIKRSCRGKNAEDSYLGKRVACPNCGKVVSAANLAKHMKRYCKQMCLSKISSKHPNEKATSSHSKKGLCICGKFIRKGNMKRHIKRSCRGKNADDPYLGKCVACPKCGMKVTAVHLSDHKKRCLFSSTSLPTKHVLPSTTYEHHGKPFQVKKQNLFSHMKNSCKAKKLLLLNNCFPNKVVLSQPTTQGGGSKVRIQVQCKHCGKHLTMSNFSSHLRTHAEEEPFSRSPLSLSCSLSFDIKSGITRKCTYSPSL